MCKEGDRELVYRERDRDLVCLEVQRECVCVSLKSIEVGQYRVGIDRQPNNARRLRLQTENEERYGKWKTLKMSHPMTSARNSNHGLVK